MAERCPHCEKPVQMGTVVCPSCGSYVIRVDDKKKVWHLYAIPLTVIVLAVGLGVYFQQLDQYNVAEAEKPATAKRSIDPALKRQLEKDEAERIRKAEKARALKEAREKRAAESEATKAWRALPVEEKQTYLTGAIDKAVLKVGQIQAMLVGQSGAADRTQWLDGITSKIAAATVMLEAGRFDQAKGLIEGVLEDLAEIIPDEPPVAKK